MPARLNGIQARQALQFAEEALRTAEQANEALQAENARLRKGHYTGTAEGFTAGVGGGLQVQTEEGDGNR